MTAKEYAYAYSAWKFTFHFLRRRSAEFAKLERTLKDDTAGSTLLSQVRTSRILDEISLINFGDRLLDQESGEEGSLQRGKNYGGAVPIASCSERTVQGLREVLIRIIIIIMISLLNGENLWPKK